MLVLSRKMGQRIIINDEIVVTVVGIKGNQIRIGVEAPKSVEVWRGELLPDQPVMACARERELVTA